MHGSIKVISQILPTSELTPMGPDHPAPARSSAHQPVHDVACGGAGALTNAGTGQSRPSWPSLHLSILAHPPTAPLSCTSDPVPCAWDWRDGPVGSRIPGAF